MIGEFFGVGHLGLFYELAIHHDVQVFISLFFNGFYYFWMPMPYMANADAAD